MRVKYAPRKNGFLICSKKGFPVQKWVGWFCKSRVKICGSYFKKWSIFFVLSKTGGDDSLRVGIFAPDEWRRLSDRFVGGVFCFISAVLLLWAKFVFKNYSYFVT